MRLHVRLPQEQRELLAQCRADLEALLEERTTMELAATDAYCAAVSADQEQLDTAHSAEADAYNGLRTRSIHTPP